MADLISTLTDTLTDDAPASYHDVTDWNKVATLADTMRHNGWTGAPIVVDHDQAITGVHRIAAIRQLWADDITIPLPVIDITDLCEAHGIDWAEWVEEQGDWQDAVIRIADKLPPHIVATLGLDAH